ncbi:ATP-binding cassette domain-containing protein [Subtercola endophyticus]|uniref:ATP-binding cassette domain-containing protein n=1 Tax=Subtercola endophyticus TaxID=2895559 RepID=UPI001E425C4A|nr:ATP-binding cassette domain-containing protein [Subtercola endophyticus]UFS58611.1 ATP-binding cassette domain-containing protein [Subtercola endophyticus]
MTTIDSTQPSAVPAHSAGTAAGQYRLQLLGVSKSFGPVQALRDVTLEVRSGEVHGLIGENGAGKSTLMAVASGALKPDVGSVVIDGAEIDDDPSLARSLGLAIVRQHPALFPELTVADNLLFGATESERKKIQNLHQWARECINAWDDRPDIDTRARVSTLNPEQKFVLEISRALFERPRVLVLDEPSEHLGAEGVDRLFDKVRELAAEGSAVVYISHRIREIRDISDRVTVLRDGVNRGTRTTAELSEAEIVSLIIGRSLGATFPEKPPASTFDSLTPNLVVKNLTGAQFTDVSFEIKPGEIIGFAGIDDNGQADIARALAGLESSTGTVSVGGRKATTRTPTTAVRSGIAYIPADRQKEGIFADLSVRFNSMVRGIDQIAKFGFFSATTEKETARQALAQYSVKAASPEAPMTSLSGGNQQKVVMTGALLAKPSVIVADQPTQGVDVGAKAEIYAHLRSIARGGSSVLVLSSDNTEIAGICDRVYVISRGQIVSTIVGGDVREETITDAVLRAESRREHVRRSPARWSRLLDNDLTPTPILAVLIIALAVFTQFQNDNYLSTRNITSVLSIAAVLAVVTAGQSVVMMRGGIDLSVGAVMSMTTVIGSFYIIKDGGVAYSIVAFVIIAVMCILTGLANWALIDRLKVPAVLATFGTWTFLAAIAQIMRPTPGGLISTDVVDALSQNFGIIPIALIVAVIVIVLLELWRSRTWSGKRLLAAGNDPTTAGRLGISGSRTALFSYVICSLLAGLAGVLLIGQVGSGDPTSGEAFTLQSVAAAVVGGVSLFGGRGSFIAAFVATILLTQVRTVTSFLNLSQAWQDILLALVTVGAVFVYSILRRTRA